ncbi:glycoside hydrolase family 2 protein [Microbacterium sp. M3]|uniref:beta-mannosidase n=1 Tax=Microbacterium arthrosphaerae TaxID=792652 RepID=A0ABU4H2D4_9MICO|nr:MULTISPECIES: glycoside hydrolase family 2 protein [Microbacterium]MDW4573501.1 glycoside hydrolase family 2 protein [Microbacterium arthrosphaerae]MDW7607356.1 glycoside hydrolase family 2 protein [Microbacterium sp. M3]
MTAPSPAATAALLRRPLHSGWQVRAAAGPAPTALDGAVVPATVPGCVHTDLLAEGLIPDPFLDDNESALAWIGLVDWTYETTFEWMPDAADRTDLVFEGLDTVTTILLNGRELGATANQHRSYRFDVRDALVEGENELAVRFRSPVKYANEQSVTLGTRQRPYPLPYDAIRKSACSFGWDWGIATYTSGIVKPVHLESWSAARLARTRVVATPVGDGGTIAVDVDLERAGAAASAPLSVSVTVSGPGLGEESAPGTIVEVTGERTRVELELPAVQRWWPAGYGEQPLYVVDVRLHGDGPDVLDATHRSVGFRDVRWDTTPDAEGTPFTLVVNDQPVFVKGVNWIPDDALTVRVTRDRLRRRFEQALDANLNLIRVWGGGLYESDDFYELADELGLLVWQDFLFACAAYAEEEPLRSEIEAEARENIVRLGHHASLVLLTGNNENLWGYEDWGWKLRLDGKTWGAHYYYELFPSLVAELAPHVPYAPGSPFSPGAGWDGERQTGPHPNDEQHGSMHLWEQWNRQDWHTYRDHRPRFVAEFGWQGPPAWTTLTRSVSDAPLTPESPGMIVHQKAMEGNTKLTNGLIPHFRMPEAMEDWHWAMQLNQALAVRTALEHFRSWAPHTQGAIVWQLNDCWPVTSWAAIDGDEREKPLYYALKNAFAPRLVTVQPRDGGLAAVLVNDTAERWAGELTARRVAFAGDELAVFTAPVSLAPRETVTVALPGDVAAAGAAASELVVAGVGDVRGHWFFAEPRDSALGAAEVDLDAEAVDGGTRVTLRARNLVRDLALLVDKVDPAATASDALVTLLPGESTTVLVRHDGAGLTASALSDPRVLRTANELVAS